MLRVTPYIKAISQISIQEPLTDVWMSNPHYYSEKYARSVNPNFKEFMSLAESRRMGKLLKRALVTSLDVINRSGIPHPDAIIMGTGLGCVESTEHFLEALCRDGEHLLKPTHFMQSTHNTIASLIGIHTDTHGYNCTYSHRGISFDCALKDAFTQFRLGNIGSALVGSNDEVSPSYYVLLKKIGLVGQDEEICGEASMAAMLSDCSEGALCRLAGVRILYRPSMKNLRNELEHMLDEAGTTYVGIDAIVTGISGNKANDNFYLQILQDVPESVPVLWYKHIFGENYSASGIGFYVAVKCLQFGIIPQSLFYHTSQVGEGTVPRKILILNISEGKNYSLILLEGTCGK